MNYDVVVIGSGPGGYVAAIRAAQLGLKTAVVEKNPTLGGTCLNVGCIPSKVLLHDSEVSKDFAQMMKRKNEVVLGFTSGIEGLLKKNKIDRIQGVGSLEGPHTVSVDGKTLSARSIILAAGSEPVSLPFLPFDEEKILSSTGALALSQVPKKMVVIGAGVIGVELGSVYQRLGSQVEFVEFAPQICSIFDHALSSLLFKLLKNQGMIFHLSHQVIRAEGTTLIVKQDQNEKKIDADVILVAVGRRPLTKGWGLEKLNIQCDEKGFVKVDDSFRTSQPSIFAIGDLIDGPMLAHKASEEGVAVAEVIAGKNPVVDYFSIPNVIYTHPEVASVGLTEQELKQKNIPYQTSQFPFKANSRARCINDDEGFVRMYAHKSSQKILGVHVIGASGSELIGTAALAMKMRVDAHTFSQVCFAHPTLSEAFKEAGLGLFEKPIHI